MISTILACKIREATYICVLTESAAPFSRSLNRADAEREGCARAGKERPRARAAVSFRCIIFSFATSRIHKKHVQLGHADGCCGNKTP